jgi:adenine-specific DNA-methyltransferase
LLEASFAQCNVRLSRVDDTLRRKLEHKIVDKERQEGKRSITDADTRRWKLPAKSKSWERWEVPFDTDPDWPQALQDAVTEYRKAWRSKMDEVNALHRHANAAQEELVDKPEVVKGVVRVSGPFTIEGVMPAELSLDGEGLFGGAPEELPMVAEATPAWGEERKCRTCARTCNRCASAQNGRRPAFRTTGRCASVVSSRCSRLVAATICTRRRAGTPRVRRILTRMDAARFA